MLSALEGRLHAALTAAHPDTINITAGPTHEPRSQQTELVVVTAERLVALRTSEKDDLETGRRPARLFHIQRWSADGSVQDFALPDEVTGQVVEVESPAGNPVKRGDDYLVEGGVIKFYRPPAASESAVVATVHGNPAVGFQDKRDCEVTLRIAVWARDAQRADQLLSRSLAAALPVFAGIGSLEDVELGDPAVRIRLLKPAATLTGIERTAEKAEGEEFIRSVAHVLVRGELEVTVALGEPAPGGVIEHIEYTYQDLFSRPP